MSLRRSRLSQITKTAFRSSCTARSVPRLAVPCLTPFHQYRAMSTSIPEKMKCILIKDGTGSADDLYMGQEKVPTLEKGQVLVKVRSLHVHSCRTRLQHPFPSSGPRIRSQQNGHHATRGQVPVAPSSIQDDHGRRVLGRDRFDAGARAQEL